MIKDQILPSLVKAVETMSERGARMVTPKRNSAIPIEATLVTPIVNYLLAPYEHGYWELRGEWNSASPFSLYLLETLGTLADLDNEESASLSPSNTLARKLSEEKRKELLSITSRLSSIAAIFLTIVKTKDGGEMPHLPEHYEWIKKLDLKALRSKFNAAANIFESNIYFDGLLPRVISPKLYQTKFGMISYIETPRTSDSALLVAGTEQSNLSTIRDFYTALGVLKSSTIMRVFAPDEALFRPYFPWVSGVLPYIIQDTQISRVFAQALDYYEKDDYQHCISTLGLIAEDYLQRIYINLLREHIPGGLTLGQTIDRLHKRIEELYPPSAKAAIRSLDVAFEKINTIDSSTSQEKLKPILREIVLLIQEDRKHYSRRIDEIFKPATRRTPFPTKIGENLNELLKWRNAASHNSRVPLGAHEADRTLFCLISIIAWWQEQLTTLDWSKTKLEVMESLLSSSKQTVQT